MRQIGRYIIALLAFAGSAGVDPSYAQSGCGPAPTELENPPEMKRVPGRLQSIDLEARQDGERLCFVDRNSRDRPGIAPTIRARPGETLRVRLFNRIEDASTLQKVTPPGHPTDFPGVPDMPGDFEVRSGSYHEPTGNTNLHFHGLEVKPTPCGPGTPPADDVVTTYFAPENVAPPPPGACQSAYEVAIPETHPAGLYWYHTHFHGESEAQTLLGLSGALVVEDEDDDARRQQGFQERILIVRDSPVPAPEHASVSKPTAAAPAVDVPPRKSAPARPILAPAIRSAGPLPQCAFGKCINTAAETQCSAPAEREQATILSLNGISIRDARNPGGSLPEIALSAGREELWRLVNAAADTYIRLHVVDVAPTGRAQNLPIDVVGLDGVPFTDEFGRPKMQTTTDPIMLPSAGRIEFNVRLEAPAAGHRVVLRTESVETGCSGDLMPARDLMAVKIAPPTASTSSGQGSIPPRAVPQQANRTSPDNQPIRRRTFAFTEYQRAKNSKTDFYVTEISRPNVSIEPYPMDGTPSSVVEVEPNSVEEWTILNFTHEIHNFHIHQIHFRVLESDDKFLEGRMLDTINVPMATPDTNWSANDPVTPGAVRLLMRFHRNVAGEFVFHCHILSHEDKGMMGLIRVVDHHVGPPTPAPDQQLPSHHH